MIIFNASGLEWDSGNRAKCQKHGVSIAEIEGLLKGKPKIAPDVGHSRQEHRFLAVGRTAAGRPLFVGFTVRIKNKQCLIRPITARYMHKKEITAYEEKESATLQD